MKRTHRRTAFTLIELVTASVLTVILVGGVFGVLTSMTRDQQKLTAAQRSGRQDSEAIIELMRRDLAQATNFEIKDGEVVMYTFDRLNPATLQANDRPCIATWYVSHDVPCLYRKQETLDEAAAPAPFVELVAMHVAKLQAVAKDPEKPPVGGAHQFNWQQSTVPDQLSFQVQFDDASVPIEQVISAR